MREHYDFGKMKGERNPRRVRAIVQTVRHPIDRLWTRSARKERADRARAVDSPTHREKRYEFMLTSHILGIYYLAIMSARIPLMRKSPFVIDPRPLSEASSAHAGLLGVSRAYRALNVPGLMEANVSVKLRQRGFTEAQFGETLVLVNAVGGDSYADVELLDADRCLAQGLGYRLPKATAVREFCEAFHDPQKVTRPVGYKQEAFIPEPSSRLEGLARVLRGVVHRGAGLYEQQEAPLHTATIDLDATIIESHKQAATWSYEGIKGYQPAVAVWAEADLVVADEFRDGNVPAGMEPLRLTQEAFAALPAGIQRRAFRADSACYEQKTLNWLSAPARAEEPGGPIAFAVSADMSPQLRAVAVAIPEKGWRTFGREANGVLRQWAELPFVPSARYEHKDAKPLRYIGLRLVKPQGEFFDTGSRTAYFAVVTNRRDRGDRLIEWHREKAGTIEHVHEEVKNGLAGGVLPSGKFGANAVWFRFALLTYNVLSLLRGLALDGELHRAKIRTLRLHLINVAGRMNRYGCKLKLRFCAPASTIERIQRIWTVFALPSQPTAFFSTA